MVNIFLTFCWFFPSFISNTSIVSIHFGANLVAQNAGNGISVLQISKISDPPPPPPHSCVHGMLVTHVAFSYCYLPVIYYLTERSLFKKCPPPHGKILKKGPEAFRGITSESCDTQNYSKLCVTCRIGVPTTIFLSTNPNHQMQGDGWLMMSIYKLILETKETSFA